MCFKRQVNYQPVHFQINISDHLFGRIDVAYEKIQCSLCLNEKTVYNKMVTIFNLTKSSSTVNDDDTILQHIQNQDWPNLFIKDTGDPNKGKGVFTGIQPIKKGTVVCDYHGQLVTKKQGEERLKVPLSRMQLYFVFRKPSGERQLCLDACAGCDCHSKEDFLQTKGRMINHRRKPESNLCLQVRGIKGQLHVLLLASDDIPRNTEVT